MSGRFTLSEPSGAGFTDAAYEALVSLCREAEQEPAGSHRRFVFAVYDRPLRLALVDRLRREHVAEDGWTYRGPSYERIVISRKPKREIELSVSSMDIRPHRAVVVAYGDRPTESNILHMGTSMIDAAERYDVVAHPDFRELPALRKLANAYSGPRQ